MSFDKVAARKLCDAATDGPWKYDWGNREVEVEKDRAQICTVDDCQDSGWPQRGGDWNMDGEFIANSRTMLPQALDRIEELEAKLTAAIETINGVQAHVGKFSKGGSTVAEACLAAWNLNAHFLSDNPKEQTAYLKSIGVLK